MNNSLLTQGELLIMQWEAVEQIVPAQAEALAALLDKSGDDLETFCSHYCGEGLASIGVELSGRAQEEYASAVSRAWQALVKAFENVTVTGTSYLSIRPGLRDPGSESFYWGRKYWDNAFFYVENVVQLTPAGERFSHLIARVPSDFLDADDPDDRHRFFR